MLRFLKGLFPSFARTSSGRRRHTTRLSVERLEDRQLLTGLIYGGGPVLSHVAVESVYYGAAWTSSTTQQQVAGQLDNFLGALSGSYYTNQLAEYSTPSQTIGSGSFLGHDFTTTQWSTQTTTISGQSVTTIDDSTIRSMLMWELSTGKLAPQNSNSLYIVYTPPNVVVTDSNMHPKDGHLANSIQDFAGYHSQLSTPVTLLSVFPPRIFSGTITYAVIPDQAGNARPLGAPAFLSSLQQQTLVSSHEMAEAVTDPNVSNGWWDSTTTSATFKDEVGDISQDTLPSGTIQGWLNGYMVQKEWSNRMDASIVSWAEVAGSGQTNTPLASVPFNGRLYLFAKGIIDGRVFMWSVGSDGRDWSSWSAVPGNGTTNAALNATVFNNQLFLFLKGGNDGRMFINRMSASGTWSGWTGVGCAGLTDAPLGSAAFGGRLYAFAKGTDQGINVSSSADGVTWTAWTSLAGGRSNYSINAVVFNNQLYAFAVGTDQRMYLSKLSSVGGSWTGWTEVGGAGVTDAAVSPAVINGRLYLFAKGIDQHAYFNSTADGANWGGWGELPSGGTTDVAMNASIFNNQLYVFAKGIENQAVYQFVASGFLTGAGAAAAASSATATRGSASLAATLFADLWSVPAAQGIKRVPHGGPGRQPPGLGQIGA
jgi:hypothetical protein